MSKISPNKQGNNRHEVLQVSDNEITEDREEEVEEERELIEK